MIIEFKIKNFLSIKEEIVLNMQASSKYKIDKEMSNNICTDNNILRSMVLYGRNAAGKSNILKAFYALKYLVINSDTFKHSATIPPYEPFLLDIESEKSPVEMEIIFYASNKIKYNYKIKFEAKRILSESLFFYPNSVPAKLFDREGLKITFGDYAKGEKKAIEKTILENQLVLSKTASYNFEYIKEAYLFFQLNLLTANINNYESKSYILETIRKYLLLNEDFNNNLKKIIKAADVNINTYKIIENDMQNIKFPADIPENIKKEIIEDVKYDIKIGHNVFADGKIVTTKEMPLWSESLGTRKLMAYGGLIIDALKNGSSIIVDELDTSLHPLLVRMLINLFHSEENNPRNAQLIFATHDSSLLDNELFRRDQIGIVDKEYDGGTVFYRISDINGVRKNIPLDKWYLSGRFNGIPVIDDIELEYK